MINKLLKLGRSLLTEVTGVIDVLGTIVLVLASMLVMLFTMVCIYISLGGKGGEK